MFDVIIIGAGVIGSAVAWRLARYNLKIAVVEKGDDVAAATSKANSGIIHAGYDPEPGTLKAGLNVRGNTLYPGLCRELGVDYLACGSLVVAHEGQQQRLEMILQRGRQNGVKDLAVIGRDKLLDMEPNVSPEAISALYAPSAAVVSPYQLTVALAENAALNGVEFLFNTRVDSVLVEEGRVAGVNCGETKLSAPIIVNAAGVYADRLAHMAGAERYDITPRKGEYLLLDKELEGFVRQVLFPVPRGSSKGILVVPTVEGNILAGPTAWDVEDREDVATTPQGLAEIRDETPLLVSGVNWGRVIGSFAGLRAVADSDDFIIRASARVGGWIDVGGIQSPGLASAPAIAERVEHLVAGLKELQLRKDHVAHRKDPRISQLDLARRQQLIEKDSSFGRIVCRCEDVSEGEIVAALKGPLPVSSLDALKRRTRAGTGRCQGGFCLPRLVAIISREKGIPPHEVTKKGPGSPVVSAWLDKGWKQ